MQVPSTTVRLLWYSEILVSLHPRTLKGHKGTQARTTERSDAVRPSSQLWQQKSKSRQPECDVMLAPPEYMYFLIISHGS